MTFIIAVHPVFPTRPLLGVSQDAGHHMVPDRNACPFVRGIQVRRMILHDYLHLVTHVSFHYNALEMNEVVIKDKF